MRFTTVIFLLLVTAQSIWAVSLESSCGKFYRNVQPVLAYGLEIEYTLPKTLNIFKDYRPEKKSEKKWLALNVEEQLEFMNNKKKRPSYLVRIQEAPKWLPEVLDKEPHLTYEARGMIFPTHERLFYQIDRLDQRYTRGAAQTHIVFDRSHVKGSLTGLVSFSGDRAQLKNLVRGYEKYLKNRLKYPAANIMHYSLATMNADGQRATQELENKIRNGSPLINETGGKYFLSAVLRAGIYGDPNKIGIEVRQFNYDYEGLKNEVTELSRILENGDLTMFEPYTKPIETMTQIRQRLDRDHGSKATEWIDQMKREYGTAELVPKNVLFVFRDWKNHPVLDRLTPEQRTIYQVRLVELEKKMLTHFRLLFRTDLKSRDLRNAVRAGMGQFAYESQLADLFEFP